MADGERVRAGAGERVPACLRHRRARRGRATRQNVGGLDARRATRRGRAGRAPSPRPWERSGVRVTDPDGASAETQSMWKAPVEVPVTDSGAVVHSPSGVSTRRYASAAIAMLLTAAASGVAVRCIGDQETFCTAGALRLLARKRLLVIALASACIRQRTGAIHRFERSPARGACARRPSRPSFRSRSSQATCWPVIVRCRRRPASRAGSVRPLTS